MIIDNNT